MKDQDRLGLIECFEFGGKQSDPDHDRGEKQDVVPCERPVFGIDEPGPENEHQQQRTVRAGVGPFDTKGEKRDDARAKAPRLSRRYRAFLVNAESLEMLCVFVFTQFRTRKSLCLLLKSLQPRQRRMPQAFGA